MTQSATVKPAKPDDELLAEIKARDATDSSEGTDVYGYRAGVDRRTLLRLLSACQARVEEARELLVEASQQGMFWRGTRIYEWISRPALGADGGGTKT